MAKPKARTYSRISRRAVALLGREIRVARKQQHMTAQELATRAGVSRGLIQRIENGDPGCQIGAVFEAATIVGLHLFDADERALSARLARAEQNLALLPAHTHPKTKVDDEF
jgi:transcriptional regulator with XRE-family HTH domain